MTCEEDSLHQILKSIANGTETIEDAQSVISSMISQVAGAETRAAAADYPDVRIDLDRESRCGYPEVIYAPGKTNEALLTGFQTLRDAGQDCLATRCTIAQMDFLHVNFPEAIVHQTARTVRIQQSSALTGQVAVVAAGTSDLPVAEEAMETLRWMNVQPQLLVDVGVAGPQRFLRVKDQLVDCQAIVVVAGMEGALPSVVGGWVSCPVIAVPTSVGYGAAFGGLAALLGMLNSCAANVAVVNIDAGFKAAYLAGMIAQQSAAPNEKQPQERP